MWYVESHITHSWKVVDSWKSNDNKKKPCCTQHFVLLEKEQYSSAKK